IRHVAETYPREVLAMAAGDRCYSVAKLFFAYGLGNSAFFPLSAGATTILDPARPAPRLVADRVTAYQPTLFFAVPSFYAALLAALGYWCRADTTRQVFQGEWLRTGDVYERSADGYYTCLGRTSDMIKAGGIWVSPAEVEARLLEHPDVAQAAVVGVSDDQGLEMPVACVVRAHADGSGGSAEL